VSGDAQLLSRLLFESRERVEMAADMIERRAGQPDEWGRRLVAEIDEYRASRGWSPHGFGNEEDGSEPRKGRPGCMHVRFVAECLDCGARPLEGLR